MNTLGELERSVMETLWNAAEHPTASEIRQTLTENSQNPKNVAVTTVLTVLSRLEHKGFVERQRAHRPHRYFATKSRTEHTTELLNQILGVGSERTAALTRFIGQIRPEEIATLKNLLNRRAENEGTGPVNETRE